MPSAHSQLPPLRTAASQASILNSRSSHPIDTVKTTLLTISTFLLSNEAKITLWKSPATDGFSVSLRMLHERLQQGYLAPSLLKPDPTSAATSPMVNALTNEDKTMDTNTSPRTSIAMGNSPGTSPRTPKKPMARPLEDFEDLYYVLLSTIHSQHQMLVVRLQSAFNGLADTMYPRGPTIAQFDTTLHQAWDALNDAGLAKTLDAAVRRARVKEMHMDIAAQRNCERITQWDEKELLRDLYRDTDTVQGLEWIGGWAPCMIVAWLEEKYRAIFRKEKEAAKLLEREPLRKNLEKEKIRKRQREEWERSMGTERREKKRAQRESEGLAREFMVRADRVQEHGRYLKALAAADMGLPEDECVEYEEF
ncbi:hypothetical protein K505DRAFT_362154 [Melanomma pulvis-pyrius CBS 109.77]|uniref:Uncharacterized protein n=1 Tax=Melanomma pulvis-pyrius CBS 109.77 TaxID=1314802 RepID=A0A6A6XA17_9PLEO|nr:hypothetical protein K505DRAFT_362154 [Melanomma pulvis-pyrius CBS 109.77]